MMDEFASRQYPVQEDMAFQRRMWIVQRIGWALLGIISLAALCGPFGYGILSKRTATGAEMSIEYERFERATRRASFVFRLAPAPTPSDICTSTGLSRKASKSTVSSRRHCGAP